MFREPSGTAALSGRDLPADETLAAFAHVNARAQVYKESGAFPEEGMDRLRATAYLDILNEIAAEDRIAYGRLSPHDAPDRDDVPDAPDAGADLDGDGMRRRPRTSLDDAAGLGGSGCPCDECDGRCAPPDDSPFPDDGRDDGRATSRRLPGNGEPGDGGPGDGEPGGGGPSGPGNGSPRGGSELPAPGGPGDEAGPSAGGDPGSAPQAPRSPFLRPPTGPRRP